MNASQRHVDELARLEQSARAAHAKGEPWWRWWMEHRFEVAAVVNAKCPHDSGAWRVENERLRERLGWLVLHGALPAAAGESRS